MYQLLVGGALSSAFIPVFTQYLAKGEEEEAWRAASIFITITVLALTAFMVLGVIFTPSLAPLVGVGFSGEQRDLLIMLMRITFPAVFFTALSGLAMGVLHSYQKFTLPALGRLSTTSARFLAPMCWALSLYSGHGCWNNCRIVGSFSLQSAGCPESSQLLSAVDQFAASRH